MPKANDQLAQAFEELADLLQMSGAERFRILAYRRAAESIHALARDISALGSKELTSLSGIGKATAVKILQWRERGTFDALEEARERVPPGLRDLTSLPGLGPRKAMALYEGLGVTDVDSLRKAVERQEVRHLRGFGAATEEGLLRALERFSREEKRYLLEHALGVAEEMIAGLLGTGMVSRCEFAGSLRRMRETIGDLDLLAASDDPPAAMSAFTSLQSVERVAAHGTTRSTVMGAGGIQVDLRVVAPDEWGAALQYFTGSKNHNVRVREHAVRLGFKLSEYGLFRVDGGERVAGETEEDVYSALGMATPLPTMREDKGEVELALAGTLPTLVHPSDIKGDLHTHTSLSDGRSPLREMAEAAASLGYEFMGVTDHIFEPMITSLVSLEAMMAQADEIAEMNRRMGGAPHLLRGAEVSITREGTLKAPDEALDELEIVIASIHSSFNLDADSMTNRVISILRDPRVNVLGHPTGRRIGKRDPVEMDLEAVFKEAARNRVALEISGHPERLDLKDDHIRLARECGCVFAIDTDSHAARSLTRMRLGVFTAQRGWVRPEEVINAWPLQKLQRFLRKEDVS